MNCPHCNLFLVSDLGKHSTVFRITEAPYPYHRKDIQTINKLLCVHCGGIFFDEVRLGTDVGGDNKYYYQAYKGGQYKYRDFSTVVVKL